MDVKINQKRLRWNKFCVLIAICHFAISFFTDTMIFEYQLWNTSGALPMIKSLLAWGCKGVFLVFLIIFWHAVFYLQKRADRRFVKFTGIYFITMLLLLLTVWPGIWRMDEFGILNSAVLLLPVFWQNFLTSVFYIISLMLFPFPAGVIIVQIAVISLIVGYLMYLFEKMPGMKKSRWTYILYIPFYFLPVLDSNLYPMRMSIYAFLELLLLGKLFYHYAKKKQDSEYVLTGWEITILSALSALVITWRSEAIYYIAVLPICFVVLFFSTTSRKVKTRFILLTIVCTALLFVPQKIGDKLTSGDNYDLTAKLLPVLPLLYEEYQNYLEQGDTDLEQGKEVLKLNRSGSELLLQIDHVLNVELAVKGYEEGKTGMSLYWGEEDFVRSYTKSEYDAFGRAYYSLVFKYPHIFLKERMQIFMQSNTLLAETTEIFTTEGVPNYERFMQYPLNKPINNTLRTKIISFLELRDAKDYDTSLSAYDIVYSFQIPLLLSLIVFCCLLLKRRWALALLLAAHLAKVPLIFLTAPSRLFMYYYPVYLVGYVLAFYLLLRMLLSDRGICIANIRKGYFYMKKNGVLSTFYSAMERLKKDNDEPYVYESISKGEWNRQRTHVFSFSCKYSILVPAYETKPTYMQDLINSVLEQSYENWELIIADASESEIVKTTVSAYSDKRIVYNRLKENAGISENSNAALAFATGDYVGLLDHDDTLSNDALYNMTRALQYKEAIMLYSDEDKGNHDLSVFFEPHIKEDFNFDLLLSNNYICHFLVIRTDYMKKIGFRAAFDGAQDYDLILRTVAALMEAYPKTYTEKIVHVPHVLYHWRSHGASTAQNPASKMYAYEAGRRAVKDFTIVRGWEVLVSHTMHLGFYEIAYKPSIFDVREDVGIIGGKLVKRGKIVDGVYRKTKNGYTCINKNMSKYYSGYMHRAVLYQDVDAVHVDCMNVRSELKELLLEYEEKFAGKDKLALSIAFCEAVKEKGYLIMYHPQMEKSI